MFIIQLNLSIHLILGLTNPSRPSSFHYSNIHFSCNSIYTSNSPAFSISRSRCLPAPVAAWSLHFSFCSISPWILLITLIWVAFTLLSCCFVRLHTSQPYNNEGTITALTTVSLCFYPPQHPLIHIPPTILKNCSTRNPCLHFLLHPAITTNYHPKVFHFLHLPENLISDDHFPNSTLSCYLHHFGLLPIHFQVPPIHCFTQQLYIAL